MRIVHLTDAHVRGPQSVVAGVDASANLKVTLSLVRTLKPDVLVHTGDFTCDESSLDYARSVLEQMHSICSYLVVTPGNHDHGPSLATAASGLAVNKTTSPDVTLLEDIRLLTLDTSSGEYGQDNIEAIRRESTIAKETGTKLLVFTHYPPCTLGFRYLDTGASASDVAAVTAAIADIDTETWFYCGHYHVEATRRIGSTTVRVTSAVSFTAHHDSETFRVAGGDPHFRVIDIEQGHSETREANITINK